jgi:hypothetical protein
MHQEQLEEKSPKLCRGTRFKDIRVRYHTDKKENKVFLICILGNLERSGAKSYMATTSSYMVKIFVHFLIY